MDPEDIAAKLERLDLSNDQATVYVRLLQAGPSKVSELVPHVEMSRTSLYRALDALCETGYATKSLDRPTRYEPQDPELVFDTKLQELSLRRDRLASMRDELAAPLEELRSDGVSERDNHWKRLEGPKQIYEAIQRIAARAEDEIALASNDPITLEMGRPHVEKAWRLGAQRVDGGVTARMLLGIDAMDVPEIPEWAFLDNAEFRLLQVDRAVHFLLVDGRQVVEWAQPALTGDSDEDAIALWTDAPGVVAPLSMLFESLWRDAKPLVPSSESACASDTVP